MTAQNDDIPNLARRLHRRVSHLELLKACYARRRAAEKEAARLTKLAFPIGSYVSYQHGYNWRTAQVIEHSDRYDRVKVVGRSGASYWLDSNRLLEAQALNRASE